MADEWDDGSTQNDQWANTDVQPGDDASASGKSFGKGRGFAPKTRDEGNDNGWGKSDDSSRRGRGGGRGGRGFDRGGRGGDRGGRGGRSRYENSDGDSGGAGGWGNKNSDNGGGWGNDNDGGGGGGGWGNSSSYDNDGDDRRRERGGGRGGGRGGRGRGSDRDRDGGGSDGGGDNDAEEKPRPPIYVPAEVDEEELRRDAGISKGINFGDYEKIPVNVSGENIPKHVNTFVEAQFRELVLNNLKHYHYENPTPIQKYAIPIIMDGRDLMATAQTGSGKTAAFLLPIIHVLLSCESELSAGGACATPNAVVLSPTRELAIQIQKFALKFCYGSFLKVNLIYGGTSVGYQSKKLLSGSNILIATPGRLDDFVKRNYISFEAVKFFVLDEADRMLDMGFRSMIECFLNHSSMVPMEKRQTLMFSATFSEEIQRLAGQYLHNHLFLAVGIVGGACKDVAQNFLPAGQKDKKSKLKELLQQQDTIKGTLLFVEQKRTADFIASYLSEANFPTTSIHGDRYQSQREEALRDFELQRKEILVATSVAARGLDIRGVKHVINYDLPKEIDEYVHRIGRTGRLGNEGKATSFYDSGTDSNLANDLVKILKQAGQKVPEWLEGASSGGGGYNDDAFGAYDYRKRDEGGFNTGSSNQTQPIVREEEW